MDRLEIPIFDTPADQIVLPGMTPNIEENAENITVENNNSEVISMGIDRAISGDTVKSVLIPEDADIITPNYTIDLTDVESVEDIQVMALDSLLSEDGDMPIYVYIQGGIQKIGVGYSWLLNRLIVPAISNIFNNQCKIYRNYRPDSEIEMVDNRNLAHLRLSI